MWKVRPDVPRRESGSATFPGRKVGPALDTKQPRQTGCSVRAGANSESLDLSEYRFSDSRELRNHLSGQTSPKPEVSWLSVGHRYAGQRLDAQVKSLGQACRIAWVRCGAARFPRADRRATDIGADGQLLLREASSLASQSQTFGAEAAQAASGHCQAPYLRIEWFAIVPLPTSTVRVNTTFMYPRDVSELSMRPFYEKKEC